MMWIEAIVIGLIVGILRGGRLANLEQTKIKGSMFILIGLLLQLLPFFLNRVDFVRQYSQYFMLAGIACALIVILLNIKKHGMFLVMIGSVLNLAVLFFNEFKMPVLLANSTTADLAQMKLAIRTGQIGNYMLFSDTAHWSRFLGKIFIFPHYFPLTRFIGFPDILVVIGIAWIIQAELITPPVSYGYSSYYSRR